jgi:hypothetical protein
MDSPYTLGHSVAGSVQNVFFLCFNKMYIRGVKIFRKKVLGDICKIGVQALVTYFMYI